MDKNKINFVKEFKNFNILKKKMKYHLFHDEAQVYYLFYLKTKVSL